MKKLIVTLMIGGGLTLGLFSCEGAQNNNQNTDGSTDSPANTDEETGQDPDGTMDSDTTSMDTTGTGGRL